MGNRGWVIFLSKLPYWSTQSSVGCHVDTDGSVAGLLIFLMSVDDHSTDKYWYFVGIDVLMVGIGQDSMTRWLEWGRFIFSCHI